MTLKQSSLLSEARRSRALDLNREHLTGCVYASVVGVLILIKQGNISKWRHQ